MNSNTDINKKILITDTSVLINFLNINRLDLLIAYPGKFLITEHVIEEITIDFPEQQSLLNSAINDGQLIVVRVDSDNELKIYNELIQEGRLGSEECIWQENFRFALKFNSFSEVLGK